MAKVTFEVTETKTTVIECGVNGFKDDLDITGTEIEKDFIKLLKKIQEHQLTTKILDALDIDKWK